MALGDSWVRDDGDEDSSGAWPCRSVDGSCIAFTILSTAAWWFPLMCTEIPCVTTVDHAESRTRLTNS
jgi:hypothetical protein